MVREHGITFDTFACLARCNGCRWASHPLPRCHAPLMCVRWGARSVKVKRADDSTVEEFREAVKKVCKDDGPVSLVVSYSRSGLNQTGTGYARRAAPVGAAADTFGSHFSPVGGYHPQLDLVLVMDTARFKYPPHWVPLPTLFQCVRRRPTHGAARDSCARARTRSSMTLADPVTDKCVHAPG